MSNQIIITDINKTNNAEIILNFINDFKKIPKCLFCQHDDTEYLAYCADCEYYFCNNLHKEKSHIVRHLNQCKHKKISLFPFDEELKCNECRENNIFNLKFFKQNQKLSILCESHSIDKNEYKSIIENKKINSELLKNPNVAPLANREDNFFEYFINETSIKINALKNAYLVPTSLNYPDKKKYCQKHKNFLKEEIQTRELENIDEPFYDFNLKIIELEDGFLAELICPEKIC